MLGFGGVLLNKVTPFCLCIHMKSACIFHQLTSELVLKTVIERKVIYSFQPAWCSHDPLVLF